MQGRTKKEAEQRAAEAAFNALTDRTRPTSSDSPGDAGSRRRLAMPELPEVETVRQGLSQWVAGRTFAAVEVFHPRAVRRHVAGGGDFAAVLRRAGR